MARNIKKHINQSHIIWIVLILSYLFCAIVGFYQSVQTTNLLAGLNKTIGLLVFNYPNDNNLWLEWAKFFSIVVVFYSVILLFTQKERNQWLIRTIQKRPFDLLIGLDDQNSFFLKNEKGRAPILIIEPSHNNPLVEKFKRRGYAIINQIAEKALNQINLENLKDAIISTGHDHHNISIATQICDKSNDIQISTLYVRVDNRILSTLFKQEVMTKVDNIDIIPFSLYENISKDLFSQHTILGLQREIIFSEQEYHIILIGKSNLCLEIIHHLAELAHFPNQNILTIHCIDKQAEQFLDKVEKQFSGINKIPHLKLEAHTLDHEKLNFYTDIVWGLVNLTNIIIATEYDDINLDIAINLQDTTYIEESTAEGMFKTKVLFALYNDSGLGKKIHENNGVYNNFYQFANLSNICIRKNIIDEKLDDIAKLINFDYTKARRVNNEEVQRSWMIATLNDRESCKSQASHIDIKLLSLGLIKKVSAKETEELFEVNKIIFSKMLTDRDITDDMFENYNPEYFPKSFDTLFNKLGRAEHNRWNAFCYLRGWRYDKTKNKQGKQHNCLLPIEKFANNTIKETYQYDLLSIVHIPMYLAHAGYEIVLDHYSDTLARTKPEKPH